MDKRYRITWFIITSICLALALSGCARTTYAICLKCDTAAPTHETSGGLNDTP
jgi:hypothetical protein